MKSAKVACIRMRSTLRHRSCATAGNLTLGHHELFGQVAYLSPAMASLLMLGVLAATPVVSWSQCTSLALGETVLATLSSKRPACFLVTVPEGVATQLVTEQPVDLEVRRTLDGSVMDTVDSFQFGPETVTLRTPGSYRVEVWALGTSSRSLVHFSMTRRALPLQEPGLWEDAERWGTKSKRTTDLQDISESLRIWERIGDASSIARTYLKEGGRHLAAGNMKVARDRLEQALTLCQETGDPRCAAEAANNSGWASEQLGDFAAALERLQQAAEGWRRLSNPLFQGRTLSNLGLLYRRTGDYQQALTFYDHARLLLRSSDPVSYGRLLNNLGLCYTSLTEYDRAKSYLESALRLYARHPSPADSVRARLNLGRAFLLEGDLRRAKATLEPALREATMQKDRSAQAELLNSLGQTASKLGDDEEAQSRLTEALGVYRTLSDRRGEASALHHLGVVARRRGDYVAARRDLTEAEKIRSELGLRDDAADSLYVLADLQRETGDLPGAKILANRALDVLESVRKQVPSPALRASYYSSKRRFFDLLVDIAMSPSNPNRTFDGFLASERGKGRALLDLLAEGSILQQVPTGFLERRSALQRRIELLSVRLSNAAKEQREEVRRELDLLVAEDGEVEAQIRQVVAGRKLGQPLNSIDELLVRGLPADSALLEYHLGERQSYAWLISRRESRAFLLPPRPEIERRVARTISGFQDISGRQALAIAQAKFERDLRELSTTLLVGLKGVALPDRLIVVPDGVLHRVPFAALTVPPPAGGKSLGLVHDLVQVPSAGYLLVGEEPRPWRAFPRTFLAVADPVYTGSDPRVPDSSRKPRDPAPRGAKLSRLLFTSELDTAASLLPASRMRILRSFDASIASIQTVSLDNFAVLHFSTHAFIDDRTPELSWVALSMVDRAGRPLDGFMRPYQLSGLRLNGGTVVLSACDTALGKQVLGEGLAGLSSSLFSAGAAQLVLSLDKVDAEASSQFFREVYGRYLGPRTMSMEHAMTLSRQAMAKSERWSDPYYWASFVVMGRPRIFR